MKISFSNTNQTLDQTILSQKIEDDGMAHGTSKKIDEAENAYASQLSSECAIHVVCEDIRMNFIQSIDIWFGVPEMLIK